MTKVIYIDGGCSGNPGPMRIAVYSDNFRVIKELGEGTNNRAEYLALIYALTYTKHINEDAIIYSDSQLLVNQMGGNFKVKSPSVKPVYQRAQKILSEIPQKVEIQWIPRDKNLAGKMLE